MREVVGISLRGAADGSMRPSVVKHQRLLELQASLGFGAWGLGFRVQGACGCR